MQIPLYRPTTRSKFGFREDQAVVQRGLVALLQIIRDFLDKEIELERICRVAVLLCKSGVNPNNSLFRQVVERCILEQKGDGGWLGVVDTMWCTAFLETYQDYSHAVESALEWLNEHRHDDGSWGRTKRDIGRIPITALMLYLLPRLSSKLSLEWLEKKWIQERKIDPKLTYKAAFTLMAFKESNYHSFDQQLVSETKRWLVSQQGDNFGWGPCKGHPVGSTPYCTGIALIGLLQYPDDIDFQIFLNALKWLTQNQLTSGLWADHYIEEGSSWALFAFAKAMAYLNAVEGSIYRSKNDF
jgi:hypothetical protein